MRMFDDKTQTPPALPVSAHVPESCVMSVQYFQAVLNKTNTPKLSLKKRDTKSSSKNTIFRPVL